MPTMLPNAISAQWQVRTGAVLVRSHLTPDVILERITLLTQATSNPVLTAAELAYLVDKARRVDAGNLPPSDALWVPTWSINQSVALGWEMKAGKVATLVDTRSKDQAMSMSQMFKHFERMAQKWKAKGATSVQLPGSLRSQVLNTFQTNSNDEFFDVFGFWWGCGCGSGACFVCGRHWVMPGVWMAGC